MSRFTTILCALALTLGPSCGGDDAASPDASAAQNDVLTVLTPPGDSIGLDFSSSATLRVKLSTADGAPIANVPVTFTIVEPSGQTAGGSSLSSTEERTNTIGIAEVELLAGAEQVNFRVDASAPGATSAQFFIQVSGQGFSHAKIQTVHEGPRDPQSYDLVELRIYDARSIRCGAIDFAEPPASLYPPRTQATLGGESSFRNLAVGLGYTIIAWAKAGEAQTPHATGCMELPADRLLSGSDLRAELVVSDLPYRLSSGLALTSSIDLGPLASELPGQAAWTALACPLGTAQLLLDCLPDLQDADDAFDCQANTESALLVALEDHRGVLDAEGCRGMLTSEGAPSLEARIEAARTGYPTNVERMSLVAGRAQSLGTLELDSELFSSENDSARHNLRTASLAATTTDLVASDRPVISQLAPLTIGGAPTLALGSHGFTLRLGNLAQDVFEAEGLAPANASGLEASLGTKLMSELTIDGETSCAGLEPFVCEEIGAAAECANACSELAENLDALLGAWLLALDVPTLDFELSAELDTRDDDRNLEIEAGVSSAAEATIRTAGGPIALPASVTANGL